MGKSAPAAAPRLPLPQVLPAEMGGGRLPSERELALLHPLLLRRAEKAEAVGQGSTQCLTFCVYPLFVLTALLHHLAVQKRRKGDLREKGGLVLYAGYCTRL